MGEHSDLFRQCLENVDIAGTRGLWQHVSPGMPCPTSDAEVLACIHMARTTAASIPQRLRFYSHRWLLDHGHSSLLPDDLKPAAERMYPERRESVGISVNTNHEILKPLMRPVREAMEGAVLEAYADRKTEPDYLKARMMEARQRTLKKLTGRFDHVLKQGR
jgi:hypothetical protein